jgi:hypothetical protein
MSPAEKLALLEQGHAGAEQTLAELKAAWAAEDADREAARAAILEAHAQGARDRDALRVSLGGKSVFAARPDGVAGAAQ